MTDGQRPRMPLIALGCAVLAVVVSVIAAIVVVTRDDKTPAVAAPVAPAVLIDQRVLATDVIKLRDEIEVVVEAGQPRGVRVKDPALAKALGLIDDDVIRKISGRTVKSESDVTEVTIRAASLSTTTLYVELDRGTSPTLVRWLLDGNLVDARDAVAVDRAKAAGSGSLPSLGGGSIGILPNTGSGGLALDPGVDQIEKLDDTHSRVTRAVLDDLLSNATQLSRGCRVVPSIKNGKPDGYKLYAIRPSSVFARLGFENGDTVHSINGASLADVDDLVSLMVDAKKKVSSFAFELTRRGQTQTLHVQITR